MQKCKYEICNDLTLNIEFISRMRHNVFLFSPVRSTSGNFNQSCLTSEITCYYIFNVKTLNFLFISFLLIFDFFSNLKISSNLSDVTVSCYFHTVKKNIVAILTFGKPQPAVKLSLSFNA